MADWDDYRGSREERDRDRNRLRQNDDRRYGGGRGDEQRSFGGGQRGGGGQGEDQAWRRDRYGSRFDQDRTNYGSGYDRDRGGYGRGEQGDRGDYYQGGERSFGGGYGGQEYGSESRSGQGGQGYQSRSSGQDRGRRFGGDQERETWRPSNGAPYGDTQMNSRASGVEQFGQPHDYAFHPQQGHEFDPDYVQWRDQQLQSHDRDYQDWRRHQHEQYDNDYRKFRGEKRDNFHRTFQDWRAQRSNVGGVPDRGVSGGESNSSGWGDQTATGGVYAGTSSDRPTGMIDKPGHIASSPTLTQTGVSHQGAHANASGGAATADTGPEFNKEPPQVRAASDGDTRPRTDDKAGDNKAADNKDDKRH